MTGTSSGYTYEVVDSIPQEVVTSAFQPYKWDDLRARLDSLKEGDIPAFYVAVPDEQTANNAKNTATAWASLGNMLRKRNNGQILRALVQDPNGRGDWRVWFDMIEG
jgi:hypothetical protein